MNSGLMQQQAAAAFDNIRPARQPALGSSFGGSEFSTAGAKADRGRMSSGGREALRNLERVEQDIQAMFAGLISFGDRLKDAFKPGGGFLDILGSSVQGAVGGATGGAVAGPKGAAVGALAGAAGGLFGGMFRALGNKQQRQWATNNDSAIVNRFFGNPTGYGVAEMLSAWLDRAHLMIMKGSGSQSQKQRDFRELTMAAEFILTDTWAKVSDKLSNPFTLTRPHGGGTTQLDDYLAKKNNFRNKIDRLPLIAQHSIFSQTSPAAVAKGPYVADLTARVAGPFSPVSFNAAQPMGITSVDRNPANVDLSISRPAAPVGFDLKGLNILTLQGLDGYRRT